MPERKRTNARRWSQQTALHHGRPGWLSWYWLALASAGMYLGFSDLLKKRARLVYCSPVPSQPEGAAHPDASQRRPSPEEAGPSSQPDGPQPVVDEAAGEPLPPEELHLEDGGIEHPRVRFEPSNFPLRAVLGIMAFVICFACFHYWAAWEFFRGLQARESTQKESRLAPSMRTQPSLPAGPRIEQLDRLAEIERPNINWRMSSSETALDRYEPADQEGFVRVPIERAMERLAGKLPVRKQTNERQPEDQVKDQGLINAGDSNSGRLFRGRR